MPTGWIRLIVSKQKSGLITLSTLLFTLNCCLSKSCSHKDFRMALSNPSEIASSPLPQSQFHELLTCSNNWILRILLVYRLSGSLFDGLQCRQRMLNVHQIWQLSSFSLIMSSNVFDSLFCIELRCVNQMDTRLKIFI